MGDGRLGSLEKAMDATPRNRNLFPPLYSVAFLLAAALSIVMLMTDKNLRTDFGSMSSGYFVHWYAVLGMAVADLVGAALLLVIRSRTLVKFGVIGSGAFAALMVAVVATYSQVGFPSAVAFAQYLFGITSSSGDVRYLYDVLFATYLGTFGAGVAGLIHSRPSSALDGPTGGRSPTSN